MNSTSDFPHHPFILNMTGCAINNVTFQVHNLWTTVYKILPSVYYKNPNMAVTHV